MPITMMDADKATQGYAFVNYGTPAECRECNMFRACIGNLEKGRRYRVKVLREKEHDCKVFRRVRVVEVEEEDVKAAVSKRRAYLGAVIPYMPVECGKILCENYRYCVPEGLKKGDTCRVEEVVEDLECFLGKELQLVTLMRR